MPLYWFQDCDTDDFASAIISWESHRDPQFWLRDPWDDADDHSDISATIIQKKYFIVI